MSAGDDRDSSGPFSDARETRARFVVDGVAALSRPGLRGVRQQIDREMAAPYLSLLGTVVGLVALAGLTGAQSRSDTLVFILLALAAGAVVIVLPALIRRLGHEPEKPARAKVNRLDIVSLSLSDERIVIARSGLSGFDVDDRLRPRLRQDLAVLLAVRHGLDIDNAAHADAIAEVIGAEAWEVVRFDREPRPAWAALRRDELDRVMAGVLGALDSGDPT